ncbi:LytTR family transcriptional regulator DNA-binding domain-containing protein [Flavobacterium sp. SUN046]|uniref:LytR/AlgR family response regulator transcription factor n=1 Tax=Flavobacterium sp. SUN046 TaxID=3002440 RepID=UPI002DBBCAB0|nr:LytTR family transcriptional regulator DNA-binding domain-containing protein [Flavobacterium sp. SUN046]MEC4048838.1 LytTR family transcriptional regulator DNA-binding domain-containing protein [Flavobacterium sp. SUN046]
MQFSYVIIDNSNYLDLIIESIKVFDEFLCVGVCKTRNEGIDKILKHKPNIVFLSINKKSESISFSLLSELHEFMDELPNIIVLSNTKEDAFEAYQRGVSGYLLNPIDPFELRKCLMRYQKNHKHLFKETISIKSNGDYNFLRFNEIIYLKADNNTTDFYLKSGKIVSAFKTLKHFEKLLPFYFFRIHHGYIININYVNRINLGKSSCYLFDNEFVLPFSRTYKESIDTIILRIS